LRAGSRVRRINGYRSILAVIASEAKQSIAMSVSPFLKECAFDTGGLLRFARNDGLKMRANFLARRPKTSANPALTARRRGRRSACGHLSRPACRHMKLTR
jgi:hypothetical protein